MTLGKEPIPNQIIEESILIIHGEKVILDEVLAELYKVSTKVLNQAVKRNIDRFPEDFMFQLSREEFSCLKSQFVTSSWGGRRFAPYAFTEQGVAMLSSVLRSEHAVQVNIQIMRSFVKLREMFSQNKDLKRQLSNLENKFDTQFKAVFIAIRKLMDENKSIPQKRQIGFNQNDEFQ